MPRTATPSTRAMVVAILVIVAGNAALVLWQRVHQAPASSADGRACGQWVAGSPASAVPPRAVRLGVGDDFQAVVDDHTPGTTFVVASGLHRLQQISARDGDTFVGEHGAVMSGARDLSPGSVTWQRQGDWWAVGGQSQRGTDRGRIVAGGNERDRHPEELFVDGRRFTHVAAASELGPGRWMLDYEQDVLYLGEDPQRHRLIEASVTPGAFGGDFSDGVTIRNLVIEKYASEAQHGAIGFLGADQTRNWTIRNVTARCNHGAGIRIGPGMTVERSLVAENGQIGIVGTATDDRGYSARVVVRDSEIRDNLRLDFDPSWEGGGMKITGAQRGVVVEQCWVHDNAGHGVWLDIGNFAGLVRSNLVQRNAGRGIFYEISFGPHPTYGGGATQVVWNTVLGNGTAAQDDDDGAGIFVSNSSDVDVRGNLLADNPAGIQLREKRERFPHLVNVRVHDNDVHYTAGWTGMRVEEGYTDAEERAFYTSKNNTFFDNTYRLPAALRTPFRWNGQRLSVQEWVAAGNDVTSMFREDDTPGMLPAGAVPFRRTKYGVAAGSSPAVASPAAP